MKLNQSTEIRPDGHHAPARGAVILDALARRARVTLIAATLVYLAGRLGHLHWLADLFAHFVPHLTVMTVACALVFVLARWPRWGAGAAVLLAAQLVMLAPYMMSGGLKADTSGEGPKVRILQFNVSGENADWQTFIDWLRPRFDTFDVIVLLENTPRWRAAIQALAGEFPVHIEEVRTDSSGIAVFSRLHGSKLTLRRLGPSHVPAVELRARLGAQSFTLIAAHTYPPLGKTMSEARNAQLHELAEWIAEAPAGHKVLLGDLNITPFSPWFRDLSEATNLADAQYALGLLPTWAPGVMPTSLGLSIDHTLVSNGLSVVYRGCGDRLGSDHCPVTTELSAKP